MGIGRRHILMKALANSRCLPLNSPSQTLRKRILVELTVVFRVGVVVRPTPRLSRKTVSCWFSRFRSLRVFLCAAGVDWSLLLRCRRWGGERAGGRRSRGLRWRHGGLVDGFATGEAPPPLRVAHGVPRARRPHPPPTASQARCLHCGRSLRAVLRLLSSSRALVRPGWNGLSGFPVAGA